MQKFIKRTIDILASSIGLIVLSPVLIIVAILVRTKLGSPIFFTQDRVGKDGKIFKMIKFRTMLDATDKWGDPLPDEDRLTPFGKLLRSTSLDELPELFNVFKGDMSLVGPRPEVPRYVQLYTKEQKKIFKVKPGITDLASIKYSDENDMLANVNNPEEYYINVIMQDKLNLNLEYISKSNLFFDIYIIIKTIIKCL